MMPQHDASKSAQPSKINTSDGPTESGRDWRDAFAIPAPIKRAFARFPLVTYPPNNLPARSPKSRSENVLYVFATTAGARNGSPSFNPTCLKWQTYLKMCGVEFSTAASNNHAAPGGSLPYLLSEHDSKVSTGSAQDIVPVKKLRDWAEGAGRRKNTKIDELKYELYMPLIDHRIRRAWLYQLYIDPLNFESVAKRLYIDSASTSGVIRTVTAFQLRTAARRELEKNSASLTTALDVDEIFENTGEALSALSEVLGGDEWFLSAPQPGLFDASVFAYTHLLLDVESMQWTSNRLGDLLQRFDNLVRHRNRIAAMCFSSP